MSTQINKSIPPLMWVAGVAMILFSMVGIGAFMGWIPSSIGNTAEESAANKSADAAPTKLAEATPNKSPAVRTHKAQPQLASNNHTKKICAECGVIQSTREIVEKGQGGAVGIVGGAVVGGLLGHQVGGGRGKDIATVAGAVGGAVAGNEIQKRVDTNKSYETVVRFEDGTSRVFTTSNPNNWREGDRVTVDNGEIHARH